ncbi:MULTISPECIES: DUF4232 domain-containing protein [Streptomyces]|uniref:DUF4232 domain-containing protein n=1 Tax=Streptomyces TaxID=1883 RepID=UPI0013D9EDF8|nr:DUF4232 domain-containing protein [Streptomyces sp. SID10692]
MRTYRNRTAVLVSAATAALALSLTACGGDDGGTKSAGPTDRTASAASSTSTTPVAQSGDKEQGGETQSGGEGAAEQSGGKSQGQGASQQGDGQGESAQSGSGSGTKAAKAGTPLCTAKGLKITAERQDGPPYTHLTLSAKNTSGASCEMKEYPHIHFLDNARGIVPPVAKSKPASPVILEPGQSAYVAVRMSEGGRKENTETVKEFTVTLKANGGGMAVVKSPVAEGLSVNPQKWATGYWTTELRNGADEF